MDYQIWDRLLADSIQPDAVEQSISYLAEQLGQFLLPKERVLICFQYHEYGNISYLMQQAALRCGAVPLLWDTDFRWIHLLRLAFSSHAGCVIGPPLILLGLAKVAKAMRTPLFIRNAVLAGYPCLEWMREGIESSLDCKTWGCMNLSLEGVVCGFSCTGHNGIHLRQAGYGAQIVDDSGTELEPGQEGQIRVYDLENPELGIIMPDCGVYDPAPCSCGRTTPRITNIRPCYRTDPDLLKLGQTLQSWTSILDCGLRKGSRGLEMEIVYFPGERLPKLPSAAKLVLRPWDPEKDEPFWYFPMSQNPKLTRIPEYFPEEY